MRWHWPLLGFYRTGIVALAIIGQMGCILGGSADEVASMKSASAPSHKAIMAIEGTLGGLALVLVIVGLVVGTRAPFVARVSDILILWLVSTLRHAVVGTQSHPVGPVRA